MTAWLTEQDELNYGKDLCDFSMRAAAHAIGPHLQDLNRQNALLQERLAIEARRNLDQRVEAAIPDYRTRDRDPEWHRWLLGIDSLSGRQRQLLLNDAIERGDASRVVAFFRSFQREGRADGSQAPGRARSASGNIYTREQIAALYAAHRKGHYANREDEWNRQEADIIAASREGRIAGVYITK